MKIEVGEYIRSVDGFIRKVTRVNEKGTYEGLCYGAYSLDVSYKNSIGISSKKVKSHSKNIIDLIEVGDYVNGYKVRGKTNERVVLDYYYYSDELCDGYWISLRDNIYSIVTKEQFEGVKYEIK